MKFELMVSEVKELINMLSESPVKIFDYLRSDIREEAGKYLTNLLKIELTDFLGRGKYCRVEGSEKNYRNGSYCRDFCLRGIGEVSLKVPRDRRGEFHSQVIPRSKQYEDKISEDLSLMYLTGISTRTLSLLSKRLIGRKISHSEISKANKELGEAVESWRNRDLSGEDIKYLFIDGVIFKMRSNGEVVNVPVLAVIGVREDGGKLVIGLQSGDKESATSWREFFKDLKTRGLNYSKVTLGIMDGLRGLESVFKEEFPHAKVQRCQVHVARNVLAKVPGKLKKAVADDLRSIFYASSRQKAKKFYQEFKNKWQQELPSAVKSLEQSIDSCLTFFDYPQEEWISLRTTNVIERLNKEFKRRTKPMEITAGENACYRLLAFISLKMEISWRTKPIGKVLPNLPFYQIYTK